MEREGGEEGRRKEEEEEEEKGGVTGRKGREGEGRGGGVLYKGNK